MTAKLIVVSVAAVIGALSLASERVKCPLPDDEVFAIKAFFNDFKGAVNSKDIELVKKMSGESWLHWSKVIDNGRLESIEIIEFVADKLTNVVAKCIAVDSKNRSYPAVVVFTIGKVDSKYSITNVRFPEHERRHHEFANAQKTVEQLVSAMNNHDLCAVKGLVSFGDSADFEAELSLRGLLWIKEALGSGTNNVPLAGSGVSREGNDTIIGRIYVPSAPGGTNVLRKVLFANGKIDRCAPREESADEIRKRVEQEKTEEQRNYEKRMAEEYRRAVLQRLREVK